MRLTRPLLLVTFAVVLAPLLLACSRSPIREDLSNGAPKVLIVSSNDPQGARLGIKGLLEEYKIPVTILTNTQATPERAREFDLIIVADTNPYTLRIAESNRPVLGYATYGSTFLGTLWLKNGEPFA